VSSVETKLLQSIMSSGYEKLAHVSSIVTGVCFLLSAFLTLPMDTDSGGMLESSYASTTNYYNIFHRSYTDSSGKAVSTDIQCGNALTRDVNTTHCDLFDTHECGVMQAGSLTALCLGIIVGIISAFNIGRAGNTSEMTLKNPKLQKVLYFAPTGLNLVAFIFLSIIIGEIENLYNSDDKCLDGAKLAHGTMYTPFAVFYGIGVLSWVIHVVAFCMIYRKSTNGDYNSMLLGGGY
jgi:hypothetical protein